VQTLHRITKAVGGNGCRIRAWKERLQVQVCDRFGLTVTVWHYPTGSSKWNPIQHRLFSQISRNWAGVPLRSRDTLLAFIRGTTTAAGLVVRADFQAGDYPKDRKSATLTWTPWISSLMPLFRCGTTRFGHGPGSSSVATPWS